MTVIGKISFRFGMADEQFARELYADWDEFCQHGVTDILEEFFSRYDKKDVYIEVDRLDLDLGGILQEEFYEEFPMRLREALEREFTPRLDETGVLWNSSPEDIDDKAFLGTEKSSLYALEKRFENLLHYLEYGFCLSEWGMRDFDLYEELLFFKDKEKTERFLSLLVSKPYIMERLTLQMGTERLAEIMPFAAWFSSPALGQYEKQRYLTVVLEHTPQTVVLFIHRAKDTSSMEGLAELLENPHVKRIMATETEHHAEIDVPEYWYSLYGWLLEYYPFNGVPMFGDKPHFKLHLNRRLLSFIHKRNYQAYLSKVELTMQFLLEVFGADYSQTVLNIIYHNQRLNADGSPASGNRYIWDLYNILLQLSLLKVGQGKTEIADELPADDKSDETSPYSAASAALKNHISSFEEWLEDSEVSDEVKIKSILRLVKEHPELLTRWLKNHPERRYLSLLATFTDESVMLLLAGQVSLQLTEAVSVVADMLAKASYSVSWLNDINLDKLTAALNVAVLDGMGIGVFHPLESVPTQVLRIVELLYKEITGSDSLMVTDVSVVAELTLAGDNNTLNPIREFIEVITLNMPYLTVTDDIQDDTFRKKLSNKNVPADKTASSLQLLLSDSRISDSAKRMLVLQWFDTYRNQESEWISALQSKELLESIVYLLGDTALRHITQQLAVYVLRTNGFGLKESTRLFIGLLVENIEAVAGLVSLSTKRIWQLLISSISAVAGNGDSVTISVTDNVEFAVWLLSVMVDKDKVKTVVEFFIRQLTRMELSVGTSKGKDVDENLVISGFEKDALLSLLVRMQEYLSSGNKDGRSVKADAEEKGIDENLNAVQTAFEQGLNDVAGTIEWLQSETFTVAQKREVIHRYMIDYPERAIRLIQETTASDKNANVLWAESVGKDVLLNIIQDNNVPPLPNWKGQYSEEAFDDWITWIRSPSVSDTEKSQMLRHYARWQPKLLWRLVCHSNIGGGTENEIPFRQWGGWLGTSVWLEMISGVSLSLGDRLRQTVNAVSEEYGVMESMLSEGLVRFISDYPMEQIYYGDTSSIVRKYLSILSSLARESGIPALAQEQAARTDDSQSEHRGAGKITLFNEQYTQVDMKNEIIKTNGFEVEKQLSEADRNAVERQIVSDNLIKEIEAQLHITDADRLQKEGVQPEHIEIQNAGLCLLAVWISRLFGILGLLTEDKKELKNMEARIRAIFILQRLVTDERREYKEQDLAFNRILTGCPFYVPLPKTWELTDNEIQTIESMLNGVKANWDKLRNTSVKGFQKSFIERSGKLEQREDKWVLYVEGKAHDILLDSLPWSYRQIRLPWLKKKINVVWRDKEEFDF